MAIDRDGLLTEIKRFYNRGDITDASLIIFLDFALEVAVEQRDWHDLQAVRSYSTVADTETVALHADARVVHKLWISETSPVDREQLTFLTQEEFLQTYRASTDVTDEPVNYALFGRTIYLGPTPNAVFTLNALESRWPSNFTAGSGTTESPIPRLERYLINYAVGWAFDTKGMDDLAQKHFERAQSLLSDAMRVDSMLTAQLRTSSTRGYESPIGTPTGRYGTDV